MKSEENRRYINLYNTVEETKRLFKQQSDYMKEIHETYKASKNKKEKEQLLVNLKSVMDILTKNISQSRETMRKLRQDNNKVNQSYNDSVMKEKDHFKRIKEFEEECDKNDDMRKKISKRK